MLGNIDIGINIKKVNVKNDKSKIYRSKWALIIPWASERGQDGAFAPLDF